MNVKLPIKEVEKPWGKDTLPPPFSAPAGKRIGEVWFEPPPELPQLLVKYIFTSEALSVQVHPTDAQAEAAGQGKRGKDECWTIIAAEPGAKIGIGFVRAVSPDEMRAAALDGSIEHLLRWYDVVPGDFFYIPANTVHAIGAGVGLIETQQNTDITYRLYDYGRPRELHLDQAVPITIGAPYDESLRARIPATGAVSLVNGPKFRLDRIDGAPNEDVATRYAGAPLLVVPRGGPVEVDGVTLHAGDCGLAPGIGHVGATNAGACLIAQPVTG